MKFLVTNDDGVRAQGILGLSQALLGQGDVFVVAPDQERSGTGHAITVNYPLRVTESTAIPNVSGCFTVDGTPADCVKMAIQGLGLKPDLIISGINSGANLGTDVLYSGTVSAAIEGVILGFPAVAVSLCGDLAYLETATDSLLKILFDMEVPVPKDGLLNINIPAVAKEQVKGMRGTKLGVRVYNNLFEKRIDLRGKPYYWMGGDPETLASEEEGIDHQAIEAGFVSITPIHFDLTHYAALAKLQAALIEK